jgi:hypothetical protein
MGKKDKDITSEVLNNQFYDKLKIREEIIKNVDTQKKTLTFFMIFFPSVIISVIPSMINDSFVISLGIKFCLLLLQLVILKSFIDTYYD